MENFQSRFVLVQSFYFSFMEKNHSEICASVKNGLSRRKTLSSMTSWINFFKFTTEKLVNQRLLFWWDSLPVLSLSRPPATDKPGKPQSALEPIMSYIFQKQ